MQLLSDPDQDFYISTASLWEIVIKAGLGHLLTNSDLKEFIPSQMQQNAFRALPVELSHVLQVSTLPNLHRDPFDRIIIAQAQVERMPIISRNRLIAKYEVEVVW